jgi:hypothetical protein
VAVHRTACMVVGLEGTEGYSVIWLTRRQSYFTQSCSRRGYGLMQGGGGF